MIIYNNDIGNISEIKELPFKLEKDIQKIFEKNLTTITGLNFVKSEFTIKSNRIDTLAYDLENRSFVIIEYKRDKNYSVIDQGVSYLNLMLEYKADFIIEYNETQQKNLKRDEVDWSQSRIIFVSSTFTEFQKQSTNFKDFSIELWEIKQFENNTIYVNPIRKTSAAPSIKLIANENLQLQKVAREIKTYTEEDHTNRVSDEVAELYNEFKTAILNLSSDIEIHAKKDYIAFKKGSNVIDITLLKKSLKIWINLKKGTLKDPQNIMRDVSTIGHWGNGDYELIVDDNSNLEYIMFLVKQAFI
jgi:predicted transport protein